MLMRFEQLEKQIGGRTLFREASLVLGAGDRVGLVGPNGAGKSTLLAVIAGDEATDTGTVSTPRHVRLGVLRQEIDPTQPHSVQAEAATALAHLDALETRLRALEAEIAAAGERGGEVPGALAERYDRASASFEHAGGFEREARVASVLAGLGFDETARHRPLQSFSGGWLMRVELAKLFLSDPDVLLLDEPTNHLDLPSIAWFEEAVDRFPGAVVTVSHDRTFLRRHVSRVAELDGFGRFTVYEGNYDEYLEQRGERQAQLLARKANQDREVAQIERFVDRFRAKSTKARQVQSRIKALDRMERIELDSTDRKAMRLRVPAPPRSGRTVLTLADIHKAYDGKPVYGGVELEVQRGDRVALVGPNGAGKSTLLRIAAGALPFDAGERHLGHNVRAAFFAQHQLEALQTELTVLQELETVAETADTPRLRGHLGALLFSGDDVKKPVSVLSGGEKARLALAKLLLHPANLLILDEPTNHLDIAACEVLEQGLASFAGSLLFVSHDRSFINALATRVVEVRGGVLREFLGNYDDYLAKVASDAAAPAPGEGPTAAAPRSAADGDGPRAREPVRKSEKVQRARQRELRTATRQRKKTRDTLAKKIARIEEAIAEHERRGEALGWKLGDPEIARDGEQVRSLRAERSAVQEQIDTLYRDWERLGDELAALDDAPDPAAD